MINSRTDTKAIVHAYEEWREERRCKGGNCIMVLPEFNKAGDLPPGVYQATLDEVVERFGAARGRRNICTRRLLHVYALAQRTGQLQRFIIFGSYVTATPDPNDVDVVLVMDDAFRLEDCPIEVRGLFDHAVAVRLSSRRSPGQVRCQHLLGAPRIAAQREY